MFRDSATPFLTARVPLLLAIAAAAALPYAASRQAPPAAYAIVLASGTHAVPVRVVNGVEYLPIDALAPLFDLTIREDPAADGLAIASATEHVAVTPGQPIVSVDGRIVSLSAPILHDGRAWFVPLDFLPRVIGPAVNLRIDLRRTSRLILVGDVRAPELSVRVDREAAIAHVVVDVQPPTSHHTTRDGNRVTIRFDADALDLAPPAALPPDLVAGVHVDGASLVVDLGPAMAGLRTDGDHDPARSSLELALVAPAGGARPPEPAPALAPTAGVRTIVIDPGHGGADAGVRANNLVEKDLTLALAERLKSAIEARLGLRVLLTRDGDTDVPVDDRTSLANNNKADVFLSLHADSSFRSTMSGAQVLHLGLDEYQQAVQEEGRSAVPMPVAGGGTRLIDATPWRLAQLPHAAESAALAALIAARLSDHHVTMNAQSVVDGPMRVLVGANMPAVLIETGFLSNQTDAAALASVDGQNAIVEALVAAITEIRGGIPAISTAGGGR